MHQCLALIVAHWKIQSFLRLTWMNMALVADMALYLQHSLFDLHLPYFFQLRLTLSAT